MAIVKAREFNPHIIILDTNMPGKTGYEVCDYIKKDRQLNQIPVILIFSENEPFDPSEARHVGATRCLPKAIEPQQLYSILNFIWAGVAPIDYSRFRLSMPTHQKLKMMKVCRSWNWRWWAMMNPKNRQ